MTLMTPPSAWLPHAPPPPVGTTSIRSTLREEIRLQGIQPKNGSLSGTPSTRTRVRLAAPPPRLRSAAGVPEGLAVQLADDLVIVKAGSCVRMSATVDADERRTSSEVKTVTWTGRSPSFCSVRPAVTTTCSWNRGRSSPASWPPSRDGASRVTAGACSCAWPSRAPTHSGGETRQKESRSAHSVATSL